MAEMLRTVPNVAAAAAVGPVLRMIDGSFPCFRAKYGMGVFCTFRTTYSFFLKAQ